MRHQYYGYHIDMLKVSYIFTEQVDDDYEVSITMDGCLKPGIEMIVPVNDIEKKKIAKLIDAYDEACLLPYDDLPLPEDK